MSIPHKLSSAMKERVTDQAGLAHSAVQDRKKD